MRWFQGSIAEAVAQSKAQNVVFIVFIEGTDDMSRQLSETLEDPRVSQLLSDTARFLSIKLSSTSPNYMHFASIYHFVPVPSLFFIGRDGAPLEVVCAGVTAENLTERVSVILTQHYKTSSELTSGASSGPTVASSSQAFIQQESKPQIQTAIPQSATEARPVSVSFQNVPGALESTQPKPEEPQSKAENSSTKPAAASTQPSEAQQDKLEAEKPVVVPDGSTQTSNNDDGPTASKQARKDNVEYEVVCDGDVCVRKPKAAASPPPASEEPSTEQMVMEASPPEAPALDARVERARQIIEQKRRENEAKEKELERQKELERRSTGQGVAELKRWQAEQELKQLAEERRREKAANDEMRQRILEQIAQDRAERRAREAPAAPSAPSPPPAAAHSSSGESTAATHTRIQLKLVDGSSHVAQFHADDTIATVHKYITDSVQPSQGTFTLWTAFPRRSLPPGDSTLRELGLVPSSALLVLPAAASDAPSAAGAPVPVPHTIIQIYTMITSLLFVVIIQPAQDAWSWLSARLFPPPPRSPAPTTPAGPAPAAPGLRYRPTNVHRLTEDRSSDDENSTWNGNSTQQM